MSDQPTQAEPYSFGLAEPVTQIQPHQERPGSQVGRYHLLRELGEGGFGTVWEAEQLEPVRRRVAMKILKPGMDSKQILARFEAERQALALMDHPHIARVLDAGATEHGRPFFVMELVKGVPITEYCERERVTLSERIRLFRLVCDAVQHAHTKGVIHRDLKPSNILVMMQDYRPTPKVIDFGIAKATTTRLTEKTLYTQHGQLLGTPEYMSPEQAENTGIDVDTRSDVYSLGVVLYELITGTTPFGGERLRSSSQVEIQRIIREDVADKPSVRLASRAESAEPEQRAALRRLVKAVHGELDWIVMRALEKDRTRRYETVAAFSDDLRKHLAKEPVTAGRPSTIYKVRKLVVRRRGPVVAGSAVVAALGAGAAISLFGVAGALAERDAYARRAADAEAASQALAAVLDDALRRSAGLGADGPLNAAMLGFPSPESARGVDNAVLGRAAARQGNYEEAENFFTDALAILRNDPGADPDALAWQELWLGAVQARQPGQLARDRGRETLERVLQASIERLGEDHALTLMIREEIGLLLRRMGRHAEADEVLRAAADGWGRSIGPDHPWAARISRLVPEPPPAP